MSGLYDRIYAALMARGDQAQEKLYGTRKRKMFSGLKGTVLEIGPGTGINLRYYPENIHWIGVEPNRFMHRHIEAKANKNGMQIELRNSRAERLDLPDESIDAVIATLVLCSVPDLNQVLSEVRRVLKPQRIDPDAGRFYFIEHVAAPRGTRLRTFQRLIKPVWKYAAGGCNPDRETGRMLEQAGFSEVHYEHFDVPLPVVRPHIIGVAVKR